MTILILIQYTQSSIFKFYCKEHLLSNMWYFLNNNKIELCIMIYENTVQLIVKSDSKI